MNTLASQLDDQDTDARTDKLILIDEKLNDKLIELAQKDNKKVKISVSGMVELTDIHERTLRSVGFPGVYDNRFDSCEWVKWTGLVIDIEEYFKETGLIENPEKFWSDTQRA